MFDFVIKFPGTANGVTFSLVSLHYLGDFLIAKACIYLIKVRKTTKIRNRYNQVPHLSQDTKWESNKITINITSKSQEVSPFPLGDHKAVMNRRESMANTRHK